MIEVDALQDEDPEALCLVVIGEGPVLTYPLPENNRITIGRAEQNDIVLSDVQVSREHAAIHIGEGLELEDLGSGNGTKLAGHKLDSPGRVRLQPRQLIEVGATMMLVQETKNPGRLRRLWTHSYFETKLEELCELYKRSDEAFSVLRVRITGRVDEHTLQEALSAGLGPRDIVASYAPGEFELLLFSADRAQAEKIAAQIKQKLSELTVLFGLAMCPADGRSPDALLERAAASLRGRAPAPQLGEPIVEDAAMRDLYVVAGRLAMGNISVLLTGETGVGKEVFAEAVHNKSPRHDRPFVRLNCAALSDTLLESELFGFEKGAFTGALKEKPGLLEVANGGTVFLDELGEMSTATQAKLLRVIEQRQVLRVGGLEPRAIDVRFISATNRDLEEEIQKGQFREDLYYRLDGVTLRIPPLRERPAEIVAIAESFLERFSAELNLPQTSELSDRAIELLESYSWPGNIRELKNVMERATLLCTGPQILPEHLPVEKMSAQWQPTPPAPSEAPALPTSPPVGDRPMSEEDLKNLMEVEERKRIIEALDQCGGNQTRAAQLLGISRRTLSKRLSKHNVPRPRKSD